MDLAERIVAISPGHGGRDQGARGRHHTEAYYNARVAERLRLSLMEAGAWPKTLRWDNELGRVNERGKTWWAWRRARYINKWRHPFMRDRRIDLVISVHHNAATNPAASGTEVYYCPRPDYPSSRIATAVEASLVTALGFPHRGAKTARWSIIRVSHCPAILTEACFVSNRDEEDWLRDPLSWNVEADAIVAGLLDA